MLRQLTSISRATYGDTSCPEIDSVAENELSATHLNFTITIKYDKIQSESWQLS